MWPAWSPCDQCVAGDRGAHVGRRALPPEPTVPREADAVPRTDLDVATELLKLNSENRKSTFGEFMRC